MSSYSDIFRRITTKGMIVDRSSSTILKTHKPENVFYFDSNDPLNVLSPYHLYYPNPNNKPKSVIHDCIAHLIFHYPEFLKETILKIPNAKLVDSIVYHRKDFTLNDSKLQEKLENLIDVMIQNGMQPLDKDIINYKNTYNVYLRRNPEAANLISGLRARGLIIRDINKDIILEFVLNNPDIYCLDREDMPGDGLINSISETIDRLNESKI